MGRESWPLHSLTSSIFISLCLKKIHWCYQENQEEKCLAYVIHRASQVMQLVKNLPANALGARDVGSIPGSGRSPGIGNGNPLEYSCLGNPTDGGAWRAAIHGVAKSWTWLSTHTLGPAPGNFWFGFYSLRFAFSKMSYKWTHTVFIQLFDFGFFILTWCIWDFSLLLRVVVLYPFLMLNSISLCGYSFYQLMNISIVSQFSSVHFSWVAQSCPTLCNPMNYSTPGLPVHWQLPEFTQTHVYRAGDAIQPSHPLSSPSPPALNLSQHQSLSKWVSSSHQVAKVL